DSSPAASATASNGNANNTLLAALGLPQDNQTSTVQTPQAPVAPQTSPTTDPNQVVAQLVRGITMRDAGNSSERRLRRDPESLGELNIKLNVDSSGAVNASVLAHSTEAHDALLANQAQLSRSLADAGLKLASFNVNLSNGGMNSNGQQFQS